MPETNISIHKVMGLATGVRPKRSDPRYLGTIDPERVNELVKEWPVSARDPADVSLLNALTCQTLLTRSTKGDVKKQDFRATIPNLHFLAKGCVHHLTSALEHTDPNIGEDSSDPTMSKTVNVYTSRATGSSQSRMEHNLKWSIGNLHKVPIWKYTYLAVRTKEGLAECIDAVKKVEAEINTYLRTYEAAIQKEDGSRSPGSQPASGTLPESTGKQMASNSMGIPLMLPEKLYPWEE